MFILEGSTLLERRCSHHFSCMCADTCFRVSSQYCRSVLYRIDIYNMIDHPSQGMLHKLVSCFPLFFSKWLHALCGCRPSLTIIEEKHSSKLFSWSKPPLELLLLPTTFMPTRRLTPRSLFLLPTGRIYNYLVLPCSQSKRYVASLFLFHCFYILRKDDTIPSSLRDKMSM